MWGCGSRPVSEKESPIPGEMIPIVFFLVFGAVWVSFSPIGKAIARRLGGDTSGPGPGAAEVEALKEEVAVLHREMDEVLNRLDFTERLLAQVKSRSLGPGT